MKRFVIRNPDKSNEIPPVTITVDDEDAHLLRSYPWVVAKHKSIVIRAQSAFCLGFVRPTLQRVIMRPPEGVDVEHINGDLTDFRRENLKVVTRSERFAKLLARKKAA